MENTKSRQIIVSIGITLILVSLAGPWISYSANWSYFNGSAKYSGKTYAEASPFTITYKLNVTSSTSLKPGPVRETIPVRIFLGEGTNHLYDPLASMIGTATIFGASVSMMAQYKEKWYLSFLGGLLCLISTISIFITLPANINVLDYRVLLHWYLVLFGSFLSIIGSAFDLIKSFFYALYDFFR